jgi:hypothetical protein
VGIGQREDDISCEVARRDAALAQRSPQHIARDYRVLNRQIDPDTSNRVHRVRRVADRQVARSKPALEPTRADGEKLDLLPIAQFADPIRQLGYGFSKRTLERLTSSPANARIGSLGESRSRPAGRVPQQGRDWERQPRDSRGDGQATFARVLLEAVGAGFVS